MFNHNHFSLHRICFRNTIASSFKQSAYVHIDLDLDFKDMRIIYNLYKNQNAKITINNETEV